MPKRKPASAKSIQEEFDASGDSIPHALAMAALNCGEGVM